MRIARLFVFALAAIALVGVSSVSAQTGTIGVYFDAGLSVEAKDCPGPAPGKLYVGAAGFGIQIIGAEYQVIYPPSIIWLADSATPPATLGVSPTGISMGYPLPLNAFGSTLLQTVEILWNCTGCASTNEPIIVVDNPITADPGVLVVRWPDFALVPGVGLTALVCATIPTQETTWGGVKALFE